MEYLSIFGVVCSSGEAVAVPGILWTADLVCDGGPTDWESDWESVFPTCRFSVTREGSLQTSCSCAFQASDCVFHHKELSSLPAVAISL